MWTPSVGNRLSWRAYRLLSKVLPVDGRSVLPPPQLEIRERGPWSGWRAYDAGHLRRFNRDHLKATPQIKQNPTRALTRPHASYQVLG